VSPDPFDDLDRALSSGLSALAPDVHGTDETLAAVRPRYVRARRRARTAKVGGTVAVLVALGSVAALAAPRSNRPHVSVSSQSSTPISTGRRSGSSSTIPHPTTTSTPPGVSSPGTSNPAHRPGRATTDTRPAIAPGIDPKHPWSSFPTTTTSPTEPTNDVHGFDSPGGAVTVRFADNVLALVHVAPATGYRVEIHDQQPDRIEVRFTNDSGEWRVDVQVDHGRLTHSVTRH